MKLPAQNTLVFYNGILHKVLGYSRENNKQPIKAQIMSLWRENNEQIFQKGEIGVKRTVLFDEIEEAPENISTDKEAYLSLLKEPQLLKKLLQETDLVVEGEVEARYSLILSLGSLWVEGEKNMLHTLVNSASSAGKGHVSKAVFDLLPKHLGIYRTRITPTALTYWHAGDNEWSWDGKLLFLDDVSDNVLNSEVLKVMLTEGNKATVTKDQKALEIEITGKPLVWLTTANSEANEEATNRLLFLSLTESEEQTRAIMRRQAEVAAGLREVRDYDFKLRQSLGLLERVKVAVPFSLKLDSLFPSPISMRRDFPRFLGLIKASAALHQYQRARDEQGRVIATWADYDAAQLSFTNYAFDSHGVKLDEKLRKAAEFVLSLLERGINLDDDGRSYVTVSDAQQNTLYGASTWYKNLDKLTAKKILLKGAVEGKGNRPLAVYYKNRDVNKLELPTSREIRENEK